MDTCARAGADAVAIPMMRRMVFESVEHSPVPYVCCSTYEFASPRYDALSCYNMGSCL